MKKTLSNQRLCVITKKKYSKEDLIKITKIQNKWTVTQENYIGRSIYILKEKESIEKFLKLKRYKIRHFEMNEDIKKELTEYAQNL